MFNDQLIGIKLSIFEIDALLAYFYNLKLTQPERVFISDFIKTLEYYSPIEEELD